MLEAMVMGKPVVASNVGGIPEVINDDCGVLVEPMDVPKMADAIIRLLEDENLRIHIGGNARRRVEERFRLQKGYWKDIVAAGNKIEGLLPFTACNIFAYKIAAAFTQKNLAFFE